MLNRSKLAWSCPRWKKIILIVSEAHEIDITPSYSMSMIMSRVEPGEQGPSS